MTDTHNDARGSGDLAARLLWFRSDHPDGEIETELVVAESDMAVCRAILRTSTAGSASAHGSALHDDAGSHYVEIAEDRALSRALGALGYGSLSNESVDEPEQSEQAPPIDLVSARSLLRDEAATRVDEAPERQSAQPRVPPSTPDDTEAQEDDGDGGADVNWNKFWSWARPRGYMSARELNELLGVDNVLAFTPREVRQMLVKYEMDNPPGGQDE